MPAAANIDQAINLVPENVIGKIGTLSVAFGAWLNVFTSSLPGPGVPFNKDVENQRTVYNWYGPTLLANQSIDEGSPGAQQITISEIMDIVSRVLHAVKYAAIDNRITADQETSVVTQFNTAWA